MICLQYFCLSYGWYFYITWLPTYLRNARHLDVKSVAIFGIAPLFLGGLGLGRYAGYGSWRFGVIMAGLGTALVAAINALGG